MPGFNQTGPMGQGPMTGRRMGRCTNYGTGRRAPQDQPNESEGTAPGWFGIGRGRMGGRGMGWRHRFRGV